MNEDNFYIKYFCKSLESYMKNYNKEYYGLKRGRDKKYKRCKKCGKMIEVKGNKKKYCDKCAYIVKLKQNNEYYHNKSNLMKIENPTFPCI